MNHVHPPHATGFFNSLLETLGLAGQEATPDPVVTATEGALWGAIRHPGLLENTVVVFDGAGQFRIADHAACWVHAERPVQKLLPSPKTGAKRSRSRGS